LRRRWGQGVTVYRLGMKTGLGQTAVAGRAVGYDTATGVGRLSSSTAAAL